MRTSVADRAGSFSGLEPDTHALTLFACFSFLGHVALFAAVVFSSAFMPEKRYSPSVIQVSMVSLPAGPAASRPEPPAPAARPEQPAAPPVPLPPEPEPKPPVEAQTPPPEPAAPEPPAEEAVSLAPAPKVYKEKTSLKKKTFKPKPVVKPAQSAPKPEAPKKTPPPNARPAEVTRAIEWLRKEVASEPSGAAGTSAAGAAGGGSGGRPGGEAGGELIDIYKAEIAIRIQQNWAFSEQLAAGRKDLSAVIVLKILPSGEIGDVWFEKRSGNSALDDSAFRAVQKSNPLPPLPKGYFRSFYELGLIFTPEGIQ